MRIRSLSVFLLVSCLLVVFGCGEDNGGPQPVSDVDISPDEDQVELGHSTEIVTKVTGGANKGLNWYVNGIPNGNMVVGTISQNSPVTFTAPDSLPDPYTVLVKAISQENSNRMDSCYINITFDKIFVDAENGDDTAGTGCINLPFKSITHGLTVAEAGMKVIAQPGIYDQANGEIFSIEIPESVALVGMDWEACVIRGHRTESYGEAVALYSNHTTFRKFTVEEGDPVDPPWSVGITVNGDYTLVDSIRAHERGRYSILRSSGTEGGTIQNLHFSIDDATRSGRGFEIVFGNVGTIIRGCSFFGLIEGIFFNGETDALVENCSFEFVGYGVNMCCVDDPNHSPNPDLGGGARGSAGGNLFTDYTGCGLQNPTSNDIYARFNVWANDPPVAGEDYCNLEDGSIIVE
jgi:hypothetical protein